MWKVSVGGVRRWGVIFAVIFMSGVCVPGSCFDALEILSGYLAADIHNTEDYVGVPLLVSFEYHAGPFLERFGLHVSEQLDFAVEPFATVITSPDSNVEAGTNFLAKYSFPVNDKIRPYIKAGIGIVYMSQHTLEQGTQINFLPQAGAGVHYFLDDKTALTFEYRFRHLSNGSVKHPNKGIDADMVLGGVSFFF